MAYGSWGSKPRNERPHVVIKIIDDSRQTIEGGVRYACKQIGPNGDFRVQLKGRERYEVIQQYDNYLDAQNHRQQLSIRDGIYENSGPSENRARTAIAATKLEPFMKEVPQKVLERREYFLSLEIEEQQELLEAIVLQTARPKPKVLQWLGVTKDELEHIDDRIFTGAAAELDLRVARKVLGMALSEESTPATERAAIYLTKVLCGWSEDGTADNDSTVELNREVAKSLFDGLTILETHRDENGMTIKPPTELKLVKSA